MHGANRKIVFKHSRAVGDCLMFTAGVRDFKLLLPEIKINVESNFPQIWENNPYLDREIQKGQEGVEFYRVGYPIINNANNASTHFTQAFLFDMLAAADTVSHLPLSIGKLMSAFANGRVGDPDLGDPGKDKPGNREYLESINRSPFMDLKQQYNGFCKEFARQKPDIHLSPDEIVSDMIHGVYGVDHYWVIAPGGKRDCTAKIWDWRRFQDVIDYFDGLLKFVVIGRSDHLVERLDNVIDLTDKFNDNLRGIFPLMYHADGGAGNISFLMHLAAGMPPRGLSGFKPAHDRKPFVAIYGGREPITFSAYNDHQILHTNGALSCCDNGGCWQSRVVPVPKDRDKNKRLCFHPVTDNGRQIPMCMDMISAKDVIRAIEYYYQGNIYTYAKKPATRSIGQVEIVQSRTNDEVDISANPRKPREINLLASLKSKGGGEQSACHIVSLLRMAGWKVNFYPWEKVHENYQSIEMEPSTFKNGMADNMKSGLPLLFYANDQIWDFVKHAHQVVEKSSGVAVGINFANATLPKSQWLSKSDKVRAVIFQNQEKRQEFERDVIGFENTRRIVLFGAVELDKFLEVCPPEHRKDEDLVVLKHGLPDYRKYVTEESRSAGDKIHLWQKHIFKETDNVFYNRLLKDTEGVRFEFMEAHKEVARAFANNKRMVFHEWNSMHTDEFLGRGHVYLHRMSNAWRDQYPRVVAEALAAGLPVLSEPRDGTKDRMDVGNIGFHCIDYDGFLYAIKLLQRKEKYRQEMGANAKDWARANLDPRSWIETLESIFIN